MIAAFISIPRNKNKSGYLSHLGDETTDSHSTIHHAYAVSPYTEVP